MSFLVRAANARDTVGIVATVRAVYEEYGFSWDAEGYHADLYDVEALYWRKGHAFFVAESLIESGVVLGTVGLHLFPPIPLGGTTTEIDGKVRIAGCDCALERLYVEKVNRGQGIGTTLLEHAIAWSHERGLKRMEIWSDKRFEDAHKLYQNFGAKMIGERICDDPDESPEWGLSLSIREAYFGN